MLALNTIHHGCCLDLMQHIPDGSVGLTLTDIPYGEVNRASSGLRNLDKGKADVVDFDLFALVGELARVTTQSVYMFCGIEQVSLIRQFFREKGWSTRLCVWEKTNPSPMNGQRLWLSSAEFCVFARQKGATFNEHCKGVVWRHSAGSGKIHPTQKPVGLFERLIRASSNSNDVVLDPFMGSGTTAIAALNTGRQFIGIEQEEKYVAIGRKRIADRQPKLQLA